MDIVRWNKETRQAFVGTLLYSFLGIIAAILTPIVSVGTLAKAFSSSGSASTGGGAVLLTIVETFIIVGYIIFFLAIRDLKKITEEEERSAFKKIYLSIFFDIIAAFFGVLHLGIIGGIFGFISCLLLIRAYSRLKSSGVISEMSPSALSGFRLLFTAEVLILIAICIGWIPVIKIVGGILKAIAWILVLFGWKKVAKPVTVPGDEASVAEKPILETMKEVLSESATEAKEVAKEVAEKAKIVKDEVGQKAKEAKEDIKEQFDKTDEEASDKGNQDSSEPSIENNSVE